MGTVGKLAGVGINDADYAVTNWSFCEITGKVKRSWVCPFYEKWRGMITRCYSASYKGRNPTYKNCKVCDDWLTFSNFKAWMETQDWDGNHLDKDILFPGNKLYAPQTCVFISSRVNSFLVESDSTRGEYMIGVYRSKGKFKAQCRTGSGNQKHLGTFNTELEAHKAWLAFKLEQAKLLAAEQTDPRVAKALIDRYENYVLMGGDTR